MVIIFTYSELNGAGRTLMDNGELEKLEPWKHVSGPHYLNFRDSSPVIIFVTPAPTDRKFIVAQHPDVRYRPMLREYVGRVTPWEFLAHHMTQLLTEENEVR